MVKAKQAAIRRPWSDKDLATLSKMAPTRPVGIIAYTLKRTEAAVRNKAHIERISFRSPERSPYGKPISSGRKRATARKRAQRAPARKK